MNINSYLNPESMKGQCDAAICKLEKDNEAAYAVEKSINSFIEDSQIKSEAFDALKLQMGDYKTVLQTMRMANQCDIGDFRFLKVAVGFQELDGRVILEQKEASRAAQRADEENAEKYRKKERTASSATLRLNYSTKVAQYLAMAEVDRKLYNEWKKKEDLYDGIEAATKGLFEEGAVVRATVENALNSIKGAFQNGSYVPDMNAGWRSEIYDIYFNRVFSSSEKGELMINMEGVGKILSKDAGEITSMEYDVIAMAYLMAEDEELAAFMQPMMNNRTDYNTSWYTSGMNYKVYSEWRIDQEKVNQIKERMKRYAEAELKVIQEYEAAGNTDSEIEGEIERGAILQRITLLDVINQIGAFSGEYEADYPTITIRKGKGEGKSKELILGLCEGQVVTGSKPTSSTLRMSTVIVSETVNGADIGLVQSDYLGYVLTNHFCSYSLEEDIGKYGANKVKRTVTINKQAVRNWSSKIKQIPGKEVLGEAIGYIPVVGDAVKFVIDTAKNSEKAKEDVKFIEKEKEDINVAMLYSHFDCCVNFVDFDLIDNSNHEFYPYEGEKTDSKVASFNKEDVLKEAFSAELMKETVLESPEKVVKFWKKVQSDKIVGGEFRKRVLE